MRLLNWNVSIEKDNTEKIIDLIYQMNADVCTFQEVMNAFDKSCFEMYNVKKKLDELDLYSYRSFAPMWVAKAITKNGEIVKDFGGYVEQGLYMLSNYEFIKNENAFYYNKYKFEFDITNFEDKDWCRSIQETILDVDGRPLQIINVHGIWSKTKMDDKKTLAQTEFILSKVRYDIPAIVVGDFNLSSESESIKKLNKYLRNLVIEYNLKTENVICDYIYVNDKVNVDNLRIINNTSSNHFPLLVDFHI